MPFHICPDEIFLFMMSLPFIGVAFHWLRHRLRRTKCHKNQDCIPKCECDELKKEEIYDPLDP